MSRYLSRFLAVLLALGQVSSAAVVVVAEPPAANQAPVWTGTPNPTFTEGEASSYNLLDDVSDADGDPLTFTNETGCTLPTGVTIDNTNKELDASSGTSAGTTTSCVFSADDGVNDPVNSSSFSIVINAAGGGDTVNAASCSQTDVWSAISTADAGDTVAVPSGSCTWSSNNSITKAVHIQGAGNTATIITISGTISITLQSSGSIGITDMRFIASGSNYKFEVGGTWGNGPFVFGDNDVRINTGGSSGNNFFLWATPGGGVVYNNTVACAWDESFLKHKDAQNVTDWNKAHTLGTADTTGKFNLYVEDNTVTGCTNQGFDFDDSSRSVFRYNTLDASSWNSHGFATSAVGNRHFEIYENEFGEDESVNQNWQIWMRGGHGYIYDNVITDLNGSEWGNKGEVFFSVRAASDGGGQYPGGCCTDYPCTRQVGYGHNGSSQIQAPTRFWGNTGSFATSTRQDWGTCGGPASEFMQLNRDWYFDGSAPGGYTPYTYPHPARYDQ